jgi:endo-1,4-beta-xylanase
MEDTMLHPKQNVYDTHSASERFGWYHFLFITIVLFLCFSAPAPAQPANGANKFLGNLTTLGMVRSDFLTYWNFITGENECKWAVIEASRDRMNWRGADSIAAFARRNDIPWNFHSLFTSGSHPNWVSGLSDAELLEEIGEWMDSAAARFPDVAMVTVINEGYPGHTFPGVFKKALGGDGATGFDWAIKAFTMARQRWPDALLIFNEYNNLEWEAEIAWTVDLATTLINAGAPIDAIGCEAHYVWEMPTDSITMNINRIAATGLPVYISEYDIDASSPELQDSIMREQFPVFWNHPKVIGVTYYGYIFGSTWRANTGLLTPEGVERPALTWLADYVKNHPDPPNDFPGFLDGGTATQPKRNGYTISATHTAQGRSAPVNAGFFDLQGRMIRMQRGGNRFPIAPLRYAPGTVISFTDGSYRRETGMDR